jgi:hypothetical protein
LGIQIPNGASHAARNTYEYRPTYILIEYFILYLSTNFFLLLIEKLFYLWILSPPGLHFLKQRLTRGHHLFILTLENQVMKILDKKTLVMIGIRRRGEWGFRTKPPLNNQDCSVSKDRKMLKNNLCRKLK